MARISGKSRWWDTEYINTARVMITKQSGKESDEKNRPSDVWEASSHTSQGELGQYEGTHPKGNDYSFWDYSTSRQDYGILRGEKVLSYMRRKIVG